MTVDPARHRFTADEYEQMGAAGIFGEDHRLELVGGEIIEMAPIGPAHAFVVNRLTQLFTRALGDRAVVSVQNPIRLGDLSEPQPDLALLRGGRPCVAARFLRPHPGCRTAPRMSDRASRITRVRRHLPRRR